MSQFDSVDRLRVGWLHGWEGFRESRRCSRETYPESYITEYILMYEDYHHFFEDVPASGCAQHVPIKTFKSIKIATEML